MRKTWFPALIALVLLNLVACAPKGPDSTTLTPEAALTPTGDRVYGDPLSEDIADSKAFKETFNKLTVEARRTRRLYQIGPEDVVRIIVWMREDLSKEAAVKDDGTLFVPMAGNIAAEGLTAGELQKKITDALSEYIRDPQVDIEIIRYGSKVCYLLGQFREPGQYPVKGSTTLLEGVSLAHGFTDKANLGQSYLISSGNILPVDFVALFRQGQMDHNIALNDGDLVYVESMENARVYVLGEVMRPAAVMMRTGTMPLAQAITEAGGFNESTAYKSAIKIIRGNIASPTVYTVNFNDLVKGKRLQQAFLKPGDIVYVPASGLAKWDRVMGQLLPSLSRIVVDAAAIDTLTNR